MDSDELRRKWAAARVWTARQAPYLASAVLALEPVVVEEKHDLRAFPTDDAWHIYLGPDVVETTPVPEIGFWILHQVTHLLRHHGDRCPGEDPARWNVAGDAEINDDLNTAQLKVPADAVTPSKYNMPDGRIAEQYWEDLPERPQRPHDCGTGADGQPRDWNCGRPGLSATAAKLVRRDTATKIKEHQQSRGDVPAGFQRWAEEALDPVVNWRQILRSAVRRGLAEIAGRVDFTYRKPSRRAAAFPEVILPSLRQPLPTVAVVIDTSGSMSDGMLAQILGEVGGLLNSLGVARNRLHVVCCDAQAYEAQRVLNAHEVRLLGGGGTDMGAGLAAAVELRPRPDLVLVLTDGFTPWPSKPPGKAKVVVGLMDPAGTVPDWATSIVIDAETVTR
ncbi:VWA-like domain-containing protein [Actinocrispum sp. NPDC049592]|uniref:vWA domain-containing protein n=1 Tax=Actinocrispum sp. NPDC049592 TaxID=3154835 RepID=UPI0034409C0C